MKKTADEAGEGLAVSGRTEDRVGVCRLSGYKSGFHNLK